MKIHTKTLKEKLKETAISRHKALKVNYLYINLVLLLSSLYIRV